MLPTLRWKLYTLRHHDVIVYMNYQMNSQVVKNCWTLMCCCVADVLLIIHRNQTRNGKISGMASSRASFSGRQVSSWPKNMFVVDDVIYTDYSICRWFNNLSRLRIIIEENSGIHRHSLVNVNNWRLGILIIRVSLKYFDRRNFGFDSGIGQLDSEFHPHGKKKWLPASAWGQVIFNSKPDISDKTCVISIAHVVPGVHCRPTYKFCY